MLGLGLGCIRELEAYLGQVVRGRSKRPKFLGDNRKN
jgi:hypothetical protein